MVIAGVLAVALTGCDNQTPQTKGAGADSQDQAKSAQPESRFADAETLRERVVDHTFTGQMGPAVVTEFYAPGGLIHGGGYRAQWRIEDNKLCLNYDAAPQDDCYDIRFDDQIMQWLHDGEIGGQGVLVEGNPNHL